jgi:predicted benzoate:H+ symporter BenE
MPTLIAQAVAPTLVAVTLVGSTPERLLVMLAALALLNVLLSYAMRLVSPQDERPSATG